jgi:hypothetical protein
LSYGVLAEAEAAVLKLLIVTSITMVALVEAAAPIR